MEEKGADLLEPQDQPTVLTVGVILRNRREELGYSVKDVSDHTCIAEQALTDIENDQHDRIASLGYLKGFVRNFARFLKLDADELIKLLEETSSESPPVLDPEESSSLSPFRGAFRELRASSMIVAVTVCAVVILAVSGGIWWLSTRPQDVPTPITDSDQNDVDEVTEEPTSSSNSIGDDTPIDSTPQNSNNSSEFETASNSEEEETETELESAQVSTDGSNSTTNQIDDPESFFQIPGFNGQTDSSNDLNSTDDEVEQTSLANQEELDSDDAEQEEPTTSEEEETPDLEFIFSDESYLQVVDNTGAVLVRGTQTSGSTLTFNGEAPFSVSIGYTPAVSVKYRGKDFALEPYVTRNTARFTLH